MKKTKIWSPNKYIFGALRKIFRWSPERKKALERQYKSVDRYECEKCNKLYSRKKRQIHVDHIIPVVDPKKGFETWDIYIKRLFVMSSNLQVLCKICHKNKTNKEGKVRVKYRKKI